MKDFLKNKKEERKFATVRIFTNIINFERVIKRMYEDIDAERIVKRQLYEVKQTESALKYAAVFQFIIFEIE